jgi:hypothetical protein
MEKIRLFAGILQASETSGKLSCRLCTAEVRGSNPLGSTYGNWLRWALGDTQHQDGNVVARVLLLEVQNGTLYSAGYSRSLESN